MIYFEATFIMLIMKLMLLMLWIQIYVIQVRHKNIIVANLHNILS